MNQSTRESIQNRPLLLAMTVCLLMSALLWGSLTPLAAQSPERETESSSSQEQAWQNNFSLAQTPAAPLGGGMSNVACIDGFAGPFPCDNMDLLAWIPLPELGATANPSITNGNDSWGWTDPEDGTEYVIMGHSDGATFLDITDPINPVMVGHLAPNTALNIGHLWGDYKVYANTLYKTNESVGEGMQFFDLTQLRDAAPGTEFTASGVYTGFGRAHNVVVNVDSGYAYAVGTGGDGMDVHCGDAGGLHIVDISDPLNPTFAGCFNEDGYTHDAQCVMYGGPDADYDGAEICFNSNEDSITIADVSDKMATTLVATQTYETAEYSHQGWLTDDHQYFLMNDELDEIDGVVSGTSTYVWDVSDLDNPVWLGVYEPGNTSIDHNLYIMGDMMYQANYKSGLRVIQSDDWGTIDDFNEVAYFDTYPEDDAPEFSGAWNVYPFFESGVIVVSDFTRGLFLLRNTPTTPGPLYDMPCEDGYAGPFPCDNVDLLAWIPLPELGATENPSITSGSDNWGWTDPEDGTEYVIAGHTSGVSFVDISNPTSPVVVGRMLPNADLHFRHLWGDYKVYANTLYKTHETDGEGMQFFDLTQLRGAAAGTEFTASGVYTGFGNAHNVAINVDSGYAYVVGTDRNGTDMHCEGGGLHIVDISDPLNPTFAGCFNDDGYTHDAQCVMYEGPDADYDGAEICFNSNEDTITIADVSDKMATTLVATQTYETASYSHQGWLTDDHQYFIMNDETDEYDGVLTNTTTYVWDVSDLDNPTLVGTHSADNTAIDHNLYVIGNMVYQANYASGLRILQANDWSTADLSEIAYFDTHPEHDDPQFNGIWNAYPFFGSGVIALNDFERGMFLVRHNAEIVTAVSLSDIDSGGSGVDMGLIMSLFAGFTMLLVGRHFIRRRQRDG